VQIKNASTLVASKILPFNVLADFIAIIFSEKSGIAGSLN
jgi:hypothetical protein